MLRRDCTHQDKNLIWGMSWRQMRVKVWSWEFLLLFAYPVATDYPTIVKAKLWPPLVWRQTTQTLHRGLPLSLRRYVHVCFSRFPSMLLTQETERSTAEGRFLWCDLYQLCKQLSHFLRRAMCLENISHLVWTTLSGLFKSCGIIIWSNVSIWV